MRREKLLELKGYIEELRVISKIKMDRPASFLKTEVYEITLNNGSTFYREKIMKGKRDGSACMVLPLIADNEVITAVQPRVFTDLTVSVDLPAGYIELNEPPEIAANRELSEETGYYSNKLISLGSFYQDHGISSALNHYYLGLDCVNTEKQNLDNDEFVRLFRCTFKELLELIELGYVKDLNSVYTILKAKTYLKR